MTVTREHLSERYPGMVFCDGLDEALIGVVARFGMEAVALYDRQKVIAIFMRDGCTYEEAEEYFEFNVIGAWVGPLTPAFAEFAPRKNPWITPNETLAKIDAYFGGTTP
jgi:hypothetical protein